MGEGIIRRFYEESDMMEPSCYRARRGDVKRHENL
jgi:hypothetical protein